MEKLEGQAPEVIRAVYRELALKDLYFLAAFLLSSRDAPHFKERTKWIFDRCREFQANPDGFIDIWSREHYKSTIITFAATIWNLLNNPELTIGIFSHSRPIAKQFLRQIKQEFENNQLLKECFPDILWEHHKQAPKWSEDDGIVIKRKGNPREASVEAWGLVDGQPIGKHFAICVYDDVVTRETVNTPEQIEKNNLAWELSLSLSKEDGIRRYIGTRYHQNDTYRLIMDRGHATPRIYACCKTWKNENDEIQYDLEKPTLYKTSYLNEQRIGQGPSTFAAQWLCDPKADTVGGFSVSWLRYYDNDPRSFYRKTNRYIFVDPANEKKKDSDYTAMVVWGLGTDGNYYVLDMVRDRLSLGERAEHLFRLHSLWKPQFVGYEKYGMQADIEFMRMEMERLNHRFDITELTGSKVRKEDRIRKLGPLFQKGRVYIPTRIIYRDWEGKLRDLVKQWIDEEYRDFPICSHDDMLDAMSYIIHEEVPLDWPDFEMPRVKRNRDYTFTAKPEQTSWMSA